MGTTADKLQKILDSKAAIKEAIEVKGVSDVGDVLSAYPDKIASIQAGSGSGYTGHADAEGLKAIGWTDEDIEYYQTHGVNWNEEEDDLHKVPQDNIDLYGVLTIDNIQEYKDRIVYLPKIDTSGVTDMSNKFIRFRTMTAIPFIDTSSVTKMTYMFFNCSALTCIPLIDTSNVKRMTYMFFGCSNLKTIPELNTSSVDNMGYMFKECTSLKNVPSMNTSNVTDMSYMFDNCISLCSVPLFDFSKVSLTSYMFNNCMSIIKIPLIDITRNAYINNFISNAFSLMYVNIKGLPKSTSALMFSNLLSKESVLYIIQNAAPTGQITIKLSAYCYNKYSADPDVVAALEAQPNISIASA